MKWTRMISTALLFVLTLTTFSGTALTAQAAEPRPPQRYEERDREERRLEKERESSERSKSSVQGQLLFYVFNVKTPSCQ